MRRSLVGVVARKRVVDSSAGVDTHEAVIAWYRERLAEPAPPVSSHRWEPVTLGPSWQRTPDGHWLLPERTLGWEALGWSGTWLQLSRGEPWRYTLEQARWLLWWYSLDDLGRFVYRDGVLQRLKGWGKDPVGATLSAVEMLGPCRFAEWDGNGDPVATDHPEAWIQTAAVSLEQTKNTMRLFPSLFTAEAQKRYGLQIQKEKVHALNGRRLIEAVTSSPATLEGARATLVLLNETQHWDTSNSGHDMADVIERNATKSPDGAARTLRITNAYEPGQDSVAQRDRESWDDVQSGKFADTGLMYDSLEAGADAPLSVDAAPDVIRSIRGDSTWLSIDRIVKSIADPRNAPSRSRRYWYNQITAAEDAWIAPYDWDACADDTLRLEQDDEISLFFDGSKSDDATGLVACRVSDGAVFTIGCWQRPPQVQVWNVPRAEVDAVVRATFVKYRPVAFFADPGSGEDETGERWWDNYIDEWGRDLGEDLLIPAVVTGPNRHPIMWDMSGSRSYRQQQFAEATERAYSDIRARRFAHDGNKLLRQHVANARRRPTQWGAVAIGKEHRESSRKIDLAVCMIGARMIRRQMLASPEWLKRQEPVTSSRVWGF